MSDQSPVQLPILPDEPQQAFPVCTRENYRAECNRRWHGVALQDAYANWRRWEGKRQTLVNWLRHYKRDPSLTINGKVHNPERTLTAMCWVMQLSVNPDRSRLDPFLDFEEHFQKVFLARGLVIYLKLLIQEL